MKFLEQEFNGKKVGEIFAQRGKEVQPEEMVRGRVYLISQNLRTGKDWGSIFAFAKLNGKNIHIANKLLFDDGTGVEQDSFENKHMLNDNDDHFFEATPDQIELLEKTEPTEIY